MRLPVNHVLPLAALILFHAVPAGARDRLPPEAADPAGGPAADYPVMVGDPFTIAGTTWTPADQLNYDAVGYVSVGYVSVGAGAGATAAHKTLPLPSYAEVTALDTGRTILVRIERRGPLVNDTLVELSPDSAAQLGIVAGSHSPIRIRRVNPPEAERALLRSGARAPERMATPDGLLKVLRQKLAEQPPLLPPPSTPPKMPTTLPTTSSSAISAPPTQSAAIPPGVPAVVAKPAVAAPASEPAARTPALPPKAAATPRPASEVPAKNASFVQIGAFSVEANARKAASELSGFVSKAGNFWRVRLGPFAKEELATAALRKAQSAGYRDARMQRGG